MAMKDKMYKNSPKIERDGESGKMKVGKTESKPEKKGEEGGSEHDKAVMKLHQKHAKERMEMHHKHEKEHLALMQKGMQTGGAEEQEQPGAAPAEEGE